eukprot:TRINITY_DN10089_c0_g1_i2.p1 TRINITY_DN10089_c0_g1~~TRINITY_DN10089_c0_g1_i2.p1  ORF type:complete len:158 (-),score=32.90 TRINITY_DN10089_c0_g1_i2:344-817(-)
MGNGAMQFAQQMYVRTEHQRKPLRQSVRYLPEDREDDERALNVNLDDGSDSDDSIEDEGVAKYRRRVRRRMMEAKQRKILYEAPPKEEIRDFDILVAEGHGSPREVPFPAVRRRRSVASEERGSSCTSSAVRNESSGTTNSRRNPRGWRKSVPGRRR